MTAGTIQLSHCVHVHRQAESGARQAEHSWTVQRQNPLGYGNSPALATRVPTTRRPAPASPTAARTPGSPHVPCPACPRDPCRASWLPRGGVVSHALLCGSSSWPWQRRLRVPLSVRDELCTVMCLNCEWNFDFPSDAGRGENTRQV